MCNVLKVFKEFHYHYHYHFTIIHYHIFSRSSFKIHLIGNYEDLYTSVMCICCGGRLGIRVFIRLSEPFALYSSIIYYIASQFKLIDINVNNEKSENLTEF